MIEGTEQTDNAPEMSFQERLKQALDESRMTQAELGRQVGRERGTVNSWLAGKIQMPLGDTMSRLARVLGVRLQWLAEGRGPMRGDETPAEPETPEPKAAVSDEIDWPRLEGIARAVESYFEQTGQLAGTYKIFQLACALYPDHRSAATKEEQAAIVRKLTMLRS